MKKYYSNNLSDKQLKILCKRTSIDFSAIFPIVRKILKEVKINGDKALSSFTEKFDGIKLKLPSLWQISKILTH